jgi:hypothetical protein
MGSLIGKQVGVGDHLGAGDRDAFRFRAAHKGQRPARTLAKGDDHAALALVSLHTAVNAIFNAVFLTRIEVVPVSETGA